MIPQNSQSTIQPVILQQFLCGLSIFCSPLEHLAHEPEECCFIAAFEVLLALLETRTLGHGDLGSPCTCAGVLAKTASCVFCKRGEEKRREERRNSLTILVEKLRGSLSRF